MMRKVPKLEKFELSLTVREMMDQEYKLIQKLLIKLLRWQKKESRKRNS